MLILSTYGVNGGCLSEHLSLLSLLDKIDFLASVSLSAVQLFPPNDSLSQSLVLVSCEKKHKIIPTIKTKGFPDTVKSQRGKITHFLRSKLDYCS